LVYAIIESGGVQVRADLNGTVVVPHVQAEVGAEVSFPRVLLVADEKSVMVGTPVIEGATVTGRLISQERTAKVWGVKYRRRKNYRRKWSQRTELSKFLITQIECPSGAGLRLEGPEEVPAVPKAKVAAPSARGPVEKPKVRKPKAPVAKPKPTAKPHVPKKPAPGKGVKSLISKLRPKGKR